MLIVRAHGSVRDVVSAGDASQLVAMEHARLAIVADEIALFKEDGRGVNDVRSLLDELRIFLATEIESCQRQSKV